MAQGEEFILGEVSSEHHYNPRAIPPSWKDFHDLLVREGIEEFAVTPLGKIGSSKRTFGSTQVLVTKQDVEAVLMEATGHDYVKGVIMMLDPMKTPELLETLCGLQQRIVHLTGIAIKAVR